MADWGIWSYLVMDVRGATIAVSAGVADHYRDNELVTFNTHDSHLCGLAFVHAISS